MVLITLTLGFAFALVGIVYLSIEKPVSEEPVQQVIVTDELNRKLDICDFTFCKYNCNYKCFKPFYPEIREFCKYTFCNSMIMDMAEKSMDINE